MEKIISELYEKILQRKESSDEKSYTRYLFDKGRNKILKKVGEETTELVIACKEENKEEQVNELCDLIYHLLVLTADCDISINEIEEELKRRNEKLNNFKGERQQIEIL